MIFRLLLLKRRIESLVMAPLVGAGFLAAWLRGDRAQYRTVFFFPFYHTGGAEKIHAQIASLCGGADCLVVFTRRSGDERFLAAFKESGCAIEDISTLTGSKWLYPVNIFLRGYWAGRLNRMKTLQTVFNGHSNFAYKVAPWLRSSLRQIDLVHSWNSFSLIRVPYVPFYSSNVHISRVKLQAHRERYQQMGIPQVYLDRMVYIPNAVPFPERNVADKPLAPIRVLFCGRYSPEKRFPLFARIAQNAQKAGLPVQFRAMGVDATEAGPEAAAHVECLGSIFDPATIHALMFESSALLLTSSTEGFPLAAIEAMANGCAILATPVGDIPLHIGVQQGTLFSSVEDETRIEAEALEAIRHLCVHPELRLAMAQANIDYAQTHFSMKSFAVSYQQLMEPNYTTL